MAGAGGQPFAVSQVVGLAVTQLDFLQEQVLIVAHDHGHAPGQFTVEARHHGRYAGNRNPSGLELWRANLDEVPCRGHGQWQVGVVGQQALAVARTLRGDCPVVRGGDAEHVQLGDLAGGAADGAQALDGACAVAVGQVQAFEFVGLVKRQRFVRVGRRQPGQLVGTDLLRQHQGGDFFLQVHCQAEVEQAEDQHRVFGFPVGGLVARLAQVHRQFVAVLEQVGVDATGVDLEGLLDPW